MTLKADYVENFSGAPYELVEYAHGASEVTDCPALKEAADAFIRAKAAFEQALEDNNVEMG